MDEELRLDEAFKELGAEGIGGEGAGEGGGDVAAGFDGVAGLSGIKGGVGAEVEEGGEIVVDFEFVGARLAVDDTLVGVAVGKPVVEGNSAGGGDENEITGGKDGVETVGVEEAEAEFGGAVLADEVGDAAEVVRDEFFIRGAGEQKDEFAGELLGCARLVGVFVGSFVSGTEVTEEVFCAGRGWEVAADEGVGGGAEIEGATGNHGFGGFDWAGDRVDFVVRTFKEAGVGVGDAHENDGIRLVAADSEDEVGKFRWNVGGASFDLSGGEALNGGIINRFRRFFVEGEEVEDDLEAGKNHASNEEDLERHITEAGWEDVALDAETDEWEKEDEDANDDGEDLGRELEHDAEPDGEIESEETEGVDDGAVTDFGGERLDVSEGIIDGFAEVLEGFEELRNENKAEQDENPEGDFAGERGVDGANPFGVLEDGDEGELDGAGGESGEATDEEESAGDAELDVVRLPGAGDFFDEVSRPDKAFVGDGIRVRGCGFGVFGGHGVPSQSGGAGARVFALAEASDETFALLDLGLAGFFGGEAARGNIIRIRCRMKVGIVEIDIAGIGGEATCVQIIRVGKAGAIIIISAGHEPVPHLITFHNNTILA